MNDEEYEIRKIRMDARVKRYEIISDKVNEFVSGIAESGNIITVEEQIHYGELMEEAHEALLGCYMSLVEVIQLMQGKLDELEKVNEKLKILREIKHDN